MQPAAIAPKSWAVVLVHGVGDTQPGQMIAAVGSGMAGAKPGLIFPAAQVCDTLHEVTPAATWGPAFQSVQKLADQGRIRWNLPKYIGRI